MTAAPELLAYVSDLARRYVGDTVVGRSDVRHVEVLALVLPTCDLATVVWDPEDGRLFEFLTEMLAAAVPGRPDRSGQP